jgi:hypothetical protein
MATTRNNTCAAVPTPSPPQAVLRPAAATTAGVTSSAINWLEKDGEIISVANQLLAATPICPEVKNLKTHPPNNHFILFLLLENCCSRAPGFYHFSTKTKLPNPIPREGKSHVQSEAKARKSLH